MIGTAGTPSFATASERAPHFEHFEHVSGALGGIGTLRSELLALGKGLGKNNRCIAS